MIKESIMRKKIRYSLLVFLITGLVVSCIVSAATLTIDAPTTVTRGGVVNDGVDNVTGSFYANISNSGTADPDYQVGFTINPQNMTGGFGDRPPRINDDLAVNPTLVFDPDDGSDRTIGDTILDGNQFHGASFYKLVPNGKNYPANDPSVVYKYGTRYYATALIDPTNPNYIPVVISPAYDETGWEMSTKPDTYNFHAQNSNGDSGDKEITITQGKVEVGITMLYQNLYQITGKNTDSQKTYFWLTGEDLPECGTSLNNGFTLPESGTSTEKTFQDLNTKTDYYYHNGTFSFTWNIPPTIKPGNYTIWVSSVNPADLPLDRRTWKNVDGVCGFKCPINAPTNSVNFTIGTWGISDPIIVNSSVVLDCSTHSVCTSCPNYPKLILKGQLNREGVANGYPLQIWIFGNNMVGDRNVIFNDTFRTFPDDQSSYEIDLMKLLLDQGITVCDIENGDYQVVLQAQGGQNGYSNPVFDITHERGISEEMGINQPVFDYNHWYVAGSHPYSKHPIGESDITLGTTMTTISTNPGYYPLFAIEGTGSVGGYQAFNMLKDALNQSFVRDQYKIVNFTVTNKIDGGVVNFRATPPEGLLPLTVQFNDTSSYTGTSYNWTFGDGNISTERNVTHVYNAAGYYNVNFTVWNSGTSKTAMKNSYINVKERAAQYKSPQASFTYLPIEGDTMAVRFIDQSYGSTPLQYSWDFGDNVTATGKSPNHTYSKTNTYNVSLVVNDEYGVTSAFHQLLKIPLQEPVVSPVQAGFSALTTEGEAPFTTQFIDQSTGCPVAWKWSFGDGGISSLKSPVHTYMRPGTYSVSLDVFNQSSSYSTMKKTDYITISKYDIKS